MGQNSLPLTLHEAAEGHPVTVLQACHDMFHLFCKTHSPLGAVLLSHFLVPHLAEWRPAVALREA